MSCSASVILQNMDSKDSQLQRAVFGPFWTLGRTFGLVWNDGVFKCRSKRSKYAHYALLILGLLPLIARTIHFSSQYDKLKGLSAEWSYTLSLMFINAHALVAWIVFIDLNRRDFFHDFLGKYRLASQEKDTDEEGRKSNRNVFIGLGILVTAYLVIACLFCVENVMARIDFDVSGNATLNITLPAFRESMFRTPYLLPLDAIIMIWENLVSGLALALIYLVSHALKSTYSKFHQDICDATLKDGPKDTLLFASWDSQLTNYISLIKFVNLRFEV
ncbi:hypothetical protein AAVH_07362 [Aphelenchoides avenae]|nr:hypothetical protein AAVH_07362 [Aphelenchus avenae]